MTMKINKNESLENREAFEYYYSLGTNRSLVAVADKIGKAALTVKRWSKSFNWQERVKIRDMEIGDHVKRATNAHVVASRAMYRETIGKLVMDFKADVESGKIKLSRIDDFIKIVNLDMELMGVGSGDDVDNMSSLAKVLEQSAMLIQGRLDRGRDPDDTDDMIVN